MPQLTLLCCTNRSVTSVTRTSKITTEWARSYSECRVLKWQPVDGFYNIIGWSHCNWLVALQFSRDTTNYWTFFLFSLCTLSVLLCPDCSGFVFYRHCTTHTTNIYVPGGIRIRNPSKRSVAGPRLRPLGQCAECACSELEQFWKESLTE
jgi:hypothetical protein